MLFKLTDKDIFTDNPEIRAIPEFANLTDRQMRYVMLFIDYESPLRKLPIATRKEKALELAGYKKEVLPSGNNRLDRNARDILKGDVDAIEKAVLVYGKLQYNEDKDTIDAYSKQISDFRDLVKKSNKDAAETKLCLAIMKDLPMLLENKKRIMRSLDTLSYDKCQDEPDDDVVDDNISEIDKFNQGI